MGVEDVSADTVAGVSACDETVVSPDLVVTGRAELAWSAGEPAPVKERRPLPRSLRVSLVVVVLAGVAVGAFLLGVREGRHPVPVRAVPSSSVTASPTAASSSAPPPPVTSTRERSRTADEEDVLFLDLLKKAGLVIADAEKAEASGRQACRFLADGHTVQELFDVSRRNTPAFSAADTMSWINASIGAYCPPGS